MALFGLPLLQPSVSLSVSLWSQLSMYGRIVLSYIFNIYCNSTNNTVLSKLGLGDTVINMIMIILLRIEFILDLGLCS